MTLVAKSVPLGSLLEDIQKRTGLKLKIHKNHIDQRVSVDFKSLSIEKAIKRILKGINYICLFRSGNKVEKIITFSSPPREIDFSGDTQDRIFPLNTSEKDMNPSEIEDMEIAMDIKPPPEIEDMEIAMGIKPPPEIEDMEIAMGIEPPPEIEDIEAAMGIASSGEKENP
ncbi:MAG: hypothetical protein U9N83_07930 [Thermodesulfobacteriota bacterium]|nr:hypothetical protein [Thermodesulfobacteriota bacterium]